MSLRYHDNDEWHYSFDVGRLKILLAYILGAAYRMFRYLQKLELRHYSVPYHSRCRPFPRCNTLASSYLKQTHPPIFTPPIVF